MQDASAIGIPAGSKAPQFELLDQSGHRSRLASRMERHGLVLVFFRSADW
jgi:peroxiredoxin